jgi:hypothetical protein
MTKDCRDQFQLITTEHLHWIRYVFDVVGGIILIEHILFSDESQLYLRFSDGQYLVNRRIAVRFPSPPVLQIDIFRKKFCGSWKELSCWTYIIEIFKRNFKWCWIWQRHYIKHSPPVPLLHGFHHTFQHDLADVKWLVYAQVSWVDIIFLYFLISKIIAKWSSFGWSRKMCHGSNA